jgi:prevent-host-death family protein
MAMKMAIFKKVSLEGKILDREISIAEAKNKLTAVVREVEKGKGIRLTRRGKPVAVLMSTAEYDSLSRAKGQFWESYLAFSKAYENELEAITDADFDGLRDKSPGRDVVL